MREVRHQRITAPDASGHGLGISDGQPWLVEDCVIDLSVCPLEGLDEAVGVTWGSRALFRRCVIRAADCRATRWWIRLEGHHGPRMSREDAAALVERLEAMRRE